VTDLVGEWNVTGIDTLAADGQFITIESDDKLIIEGQEENLMSGYIEDGYYASNFSAIIMYLSDLEVLYISFITESGDTMTGDAVVVDEDTIYLFVTFEENGMSETDTLYLERA
jgi:hypothetical protein